MSAPYVWDEVKPYPVKPLLSHTIVLGTSDDWRQDPQRADYIAGLQRMDWSHEFSDDYSAYCKGRDELARLRGLRAVVDADGALWRQYAPVGVLA